MNEYIKDYFTLSNEEKFNKIKTISMNLFERYIDTSTEYKFNITLDLLLQRIEDDIEYAEMMENYEVCEVGNRIYKIFKQLKYNV